MKKKIISCCCILLLGGILLWFLQLLLVPKYLSQNREGALVSEYYYESTPHDVLFLGDCEVYESFTPPTLWQEHGLTSFVRGTPQQLVWQSYYLLEDTLRVETPRAVVFNVYAMRYGAPQNEAYNRITLDGMRFSTVKLRAILASMTEEESFLSYILPILRYHSRWKEIGKEDFQYLLHRGLVSHNGYLMQKGIEPMTVNIEGTPLEDPTLPQICFDYLERMRLLCEERGIALILVKAPTNFWGYYWYAEWEAQIAAYAAEHTLPYYNLIPHAEEIGLDWATDTYDGGAHLNVYGAEKLTSYFGKILKEEIGLTAREQTAEEVEIWNGKLDRYLSERNGG